MVDPYASAVSLLMLVSFLLIRVRFPSVETFTESWAEVRRRLQEPDEAEASSEAGARQGMWAECNLC